MAQHRDRAEEPSAPASLSEGFWGRLWILAEDVDAILAMVYAERKPL